MFKLWLVEPTFEVHPPTLLLTAASHSGLGSFDIFTLLRRYLHWCFERVQTIFFFISEPGFGRQSWRGEYHHLRASPKNRQLDFSPLFLQASIFQLKKNILSFFPGSPKILSSCCPFSPYAHHVFSAASPLVFVPSRSL